MFRATVCPSSGEITVSVRHLVFVTLYGWLSGMQGVEKRNKHTKKNYAPSWLYLQVDTGMHVHQNIKLRGDRCAVVGVVSNVMYYQMRGTGHTCERYQCRYKNCYQDSCVPHIHETTYRQLLSWFIYVSLLTLRLLMSYIYIYIYDISNLRVNDLTLILLTWRKWWTNNASK